MSKPFEGGQDEAWAEGELRRACTELDGHIPDGYFDGFSSRLAAKLEMESMETTEHADLSTPSTLPPKGEEERDEHSGLHEIKELAGAARAKIKRRRTTEHDIEESLLASSSSGLPAVVLPDPERSTPQIEIMSASSQAIELSAGVQAPSSFGAGVAEGSAPKPWLWVAIGGSALAAVAVALLLVMGGGKDKAANQELAQAPADGVKSEAMTATAKQEPPPPPAKPAAAEPVVQPLEDADEDRFADLQAARAGEATDTEEEAAPGRAMVAGLKSEDKRAKADSARERAAKVAEEKKKKQKNVEGAESDAESEPDPKDKKEKKGDGQDISSILDEVTGSGGSILPEPEDDKPKVDKKRLGSSDVKTAMGKIRGTVNRCGSKVGFTGRVSTRFSVSPSGRVVKATANVSNAKVKRCVEAAIKRAKFPTFEPPSMSFSYPFLITD